MNAAEAYYTFRSSMTAPKQVVVIGGSGAGLFVIKDLLKATTPQQVQVTLVEKQESWYYTLATPRAVLDAEFAKTVVFPYSSLFSSANQGQVVHSTVTRVDPATKTVTLENGNVLNYDHLVVASGTSYTLFKPERSTTEDTLAYLKSHADYLKTVKNVVIVGGGPSGIETAVEMVDYIPGVKVTLMHSGSTLLSAVPAIPDSFKQKLKSRLEAKGITVTLNTKADISAVPTDPFTPHIINGINSDYTVIAAGSVSPNSIFLPESSLDVKRFVKVKHSLEIDDDVFGSGTAYALGDVAATGADKTFLAAKDQASIVAANLLVKLNGKGKLKQYAGVPAKMMVLSLGKNDGTGYLPTMFMPGFLVDRIARSIKSPDFFSKRNAADLLNIHG